ncbi:MAG: hypothetical protein K8R23_17230 [Chthoniobacter sp.]|nr:hypothetical protein [Chthoniobacter sp.]
MTMPCAYGRGCEGIAAFSGAALPQVVALAQSPEQAVDGAVSLLADAQLASFAETWNAGGDATRYAAALEALVAKFPRGWVQREAASLLAARVRSRTARRRGGCETAADFLLKLKPAQVAEVPLERNWFLPGGG